MAEYKKRCEKCREYFQPQNGISKFCEDCRGPAKKVNNRNGYNRYKKNPMPAVRPLTQMEEFCAMSLAEQKDKVAKLGNQIYMMTKELRPLMLQFKKFKEHYEAQHFGWKWSKDD